MGGMEECDRLTGMFGCQIRLVFHLAASGVRVSVRGKLGWGVRLRPWALFPSPSPWKPQSEPQSARAAPVGYGWQRRGGGGGGEEGSMGRGRATRPRRSAVRARAPTQPTHLGRHEGVVCRQLDVDLEDALVGVAGTP